MNDNAISPNEPSDDEVLAGVRRHMTGVEALVPTPGVWTEQAAPTRSTARAGVRSRVAFAGLAPLVLVAALVVLVIGPNLGGKSSGPASNMPGVTIVYELVAGPGQAVGDADLDTTVQILKARLSSYGGGAVTVEKLPPDRVSVTVFGAFDTAQLIEQITPTGKLEFVLLPSTTYGDVTSPGSIAIPAKGARIDPSLPAQFTGADIDPQQVTVAGVTNTPGTYLVNFAFSSEHAGEFSNWSSQHINEYFAIVLDGVVQSVPYITDPMTWPGEIAGYYTLSQASFLAEIIRSGALPFPLNQVSMTSTSQAGSSGSLAPIVAPSIRTPSDIPSDGRVLGNPSAPVTLDVWVDYQCPSCRTFA